MHSPFHFSFEEKFISLRGKINLSEKAVLPGLIPFVLNLDSLYKRKLQGKKL
jgi:hypothetical protein